MEIAVAAFEPCMRQQSRPAMPGSRDEDHIEIALDDDAIQVHVEKVETGRRAPVAEQPRLHVLDGERLTEERVVHEIDLAHRQKIRGAPIGVHLLDQRRVDR